MHLHDFCEICDMQKFKNVENDIFKIKLFPYSLAGKALDWILVRPIGNFSSWFNLKDAFVGRFGSPKKLSKLREKNILI